MSDNEYERFEINDYDLQNEFNPNRRGRRNTKKQQIYGECIAHRTLLHNRLDDPNAIIRYSQASSPRTTAMTTRTPAASSAEAAVAQPRPKTTPLTCPSSAEASRARRKSPTKK